MTRHRFRFAATVCAGLIAVGACRTVRQPTAPELTIAPVFRLPGAAIDFIAASPDGFVFVLTRSGDIYRSGQNGSSPWRLITQTPRHFVTRGPAAIPIFAPLTQREIRVYASTWVLRWDEGTGWREDTAQFADRSLWCGDYGVHLGVNGAWARSDSDVYLVGRNGRVIHIEGSDWRIEPTPLSAAGKNPCFDTWAQDLQAVGGDDSTVYAGGGSLIRRLGDGTWHDVPLPARSGYYAYVGGIAQTSNGPLFAIGYARHDSNNGQSVSLWRLAPNGWQRVAQGPPTFYQADHGSGDGRDVAEFSAYWGSMIVVKGGRVRMWDLGTFQFRGAAAAAGAVFVAGRVHDTAMVARLPF